MHPGRVLYSLWNWSWTLKEGLNLGEKGGRLSREMERKQSPESIRVQGLDLEEL